jgi:purine-binding chemotaxis protein CheW
MARVEETGVREFLAFCVGNERYALPLSCVREITRLPPVAEVPRAPAEVLGIISVRGQVTTLIDMRKKLALDAPALGSRARVLLVDQGEEILGLVCDRVVQVYRLTEEEVELASALGSESSSYVMGIGRPGLRKGTGGAAAKARATVSAHDILILLDPIALLKRHLHE